MGSQRRADVCLAERWQLHEVILGDRFHRFSGLAPGSQSADDHERVETFFAQYVRHPGAGRFARSSAVEVNIFIFGEGLDFLLKVVGLDANRILNAGGAGIIIAVAADVDDQHVVRIR